LIYIDNKLSSFKIHVRPEKRVRLQTPVSFEQNDPCSSILILENFEPLEINPQDIKLELKSDKEKVVIHELHPVPDKNNEFEVKFTPEEEGKHQFHLHIHDKKYELPCIEIRPAIQERTLVEPVSETVVPPVLVSIEELKKLPPTHLHINLISGHELMAKDIGGTSDPYVIIKLGNVSLKSNAIQKTLNPVWKEHFDIELAKVRGCKDLMIEGFDEDLITADDSLGKCTYPINNLKPHEPPTEVTWKLSGSEGFFEKNKGYIKAKLALIHKDPSKEKQKKGPLFVETIYPPEKDVVVNTSIAIKVTIKDTWTQEYVDQPGSVLEIKIRSPDANSTTLTIDPKKHSTTPGIYNLTFTPSVVGDYEFMCYFNDQQVQTKNTKFKVNPVKKGWFS